MVDIIKGLFENHENLEETSDIDFLKEKGSDQTKDIIKHIQKIVSLFKDS